MADDPETRRLEILASEDCEDRAMCFELPGEDDPRLREGTVLVLALENPDRNEQVHNVHAIAGTKAAGDHDGTSADDAIASTSTLDPGDEDETRLTVPSGEELYLWCNVEGHEAAGMWREILVTP